MQGMNILIILFSIFAATTVVSFADFFDTGIAQQDNSLMSQFNKTAVQNAQNPSEYSALQYIDYATTGGIFSKIVGYITIFLSLIGNAFSFAGSISSMVGFYVPPEVVGLVIFCVMGVSVSFLVIYLLTSKNVQW